LDASTLGCGSFVGVPIGYALKKVIKIVAIIMAIIIGLFLAGLVVYLQYDQIINVTG
jgi:uncharacterized membrane protein (Fun14 family)